MAGLILDFRFWILDFFVDFLGFIRVYTPKSSDPIWWTNQYSPARVTGDG
ncbi:hypothetical protein LYNGBM3L_28330 [Moorena producens 3L]|uniref:Uncharacterized protein n=1 Tax=Moorena producens 3L TaxID=489825 RepID=F4XP73_9CYAN|nr:hypothetical protein LYNGBM3L_28330 [Moorena producens 3L]